MEHSEILHPEQFADFLGPMGSYGDPNVAGVGYAGVGISSGVGEGI